MPKLAGEKEYILELITRIIRECPRRQATSHDESRAAEIVADEMRKVGLAVDFHDFCSNDNLYANLALHFGLGSLGTAISPLAPHQMRLIRAQSAPRLVVGK